MNTMNIIDPIIINTNPNVGNPSFLSFSPSLFFFSGFIFIQYYQ